jgi:class 3 adenylate cyclase/Tfp pilus assembly protein PilF
VKPSIPSFIYEQFQKNQKHGLFKATTLFIDISGFTPLTESLLKHGKTGAEILSEILDDIFVPITTLVYERGGMIPYFAGDAFVAIFENEQALEVADIAMQIKRGFCSRPSFSTPLGKYAVSLRIGLSYGFVEWGIVGDDIKTFYFKGTATERAINAQQKAEPNTIVFDEWFKEIFYTGNTIQVDIEAIDTPFYILKDLNITYDDQAFDTSIEYNENELQSTPSVIRNQIFFERSVLTHFLPESVVDFNHKGEFREVVSVFIAFENMNSYEDINMVGTIVLNCFKTYNGYFKEIDFGDKGCMMVGFFGAPIAYEQQISRALDCVLAIKSALEPLQKTKPYRMRAGITLGVTYAGVIGSKMRCQYGVIGDKVNLAARIMQKSGDNEILTDRNIATTLQYEFIEKGVMQYKGVAADTAIFSLKSKSLLEKTPFLGNIVGRDAELAMLLEQITIGLNGEGNQILCIYGEAGIGKSRLLFELNQNVNTCLKMTWATCPSDQILRKPFNPFIYFLKNYFKQNSMQTALENKLVFEKIFNQLVRNLPPTEGGELKRTQSLIAAQLGILYPDSLWEHLDAKGRYDNTIAALIYFFKGLSYQQPLVIELEDAHWLDNDSVSFLGKYIAKIKNAPIVVIASFRYNDDGTKPMPFPFNPTMPVYELDLTGFKPDDLLELAHQKLRGDIQAELLDFLWRTGNGNAFYTEQILDYLNENNLLIFKDEAWTVKDTQIKTLASVSAILTARIDRLSTILKETVKTAAVIGREFDIPILAEVMLSNEEYIRHNGNGKIMLKEQVINAERNHIWRSMSELRYIFHHTLLRETAYDMQLTIRLRELHELTACAIEKLYYDKIEERYIDLAFHFERAENRPKAVEYLTKAAEKARQNYQNKQALDLYNRLLKNETDEINIIKIWVKKGGINQLIGNWQEAEACYKEALILSKNKTKNILGLTHDALGVLLMLRGDYPTAQKFLERAAAYFEQSIDNQGIATAYGNLGNLHFRQGVYEMAKDYFNRSLEISRENDFKINPQLVANLGLTYMNQGNFTEGVHCLETELSHFELENDLIAKAILYVNLGIIWFERGHNDAALDCLKRGLVLSQELGNKQLTSIALGCIGQVYLEKEDKIQAEKYLQQDFQLVEELGDKQGLAIISELMGRFEFKNNNLEKADQYFQQSLSISRKINYPKGIAKALLGLGEIQYFKEAYVSADTFFEEAIEICRNIHNNIVLGYCLIFKNKTWAAQGKEIDKIEEELYKIAQQLGSERLNAYVENFKTYA